MAHDIIWGKIPEVGDKVYVDFGDSTIDGGEVTGWVKSYQDDFFILTDENGNVIEHFHISDACHVEVVED